MWARKEGIVMSVSELKEEEEGEGDD